MKNFLMGGASLIGLVLLISAFSFPVKTTETTPVATIKWYTWEEAIKASEREKKKIFVDVYTEWCGWCKRMDKTTFTDAKVVEYMNQHFYAVKFDAEQKGPIQYKGYTLEYRSTGKRGVHDLAYSLLDGRLGYPSVVYLDEKQDRITVSPGYKSAQDLIKELKFIGGDHYKTTSWDNFVGR